jgi:hypothetical protein
VVMIALRWISCMSRELDMSRELVDVDSFI